MYKLKCRDEDFLVSEVPSLPPAAEGPFTHVWLEKCGYTTFEALDLLAAALGISPGDLHVHGLKDEDGVTAQVVSLPVVLDEGRWSAFNERHGHGARRALVRHALGRGARPVARKRPHGNTFRLVVRDLAPAASEGLGALCRHRYQSFVNYYDEQRFGMAGGPFNAHLIGEAIIEQDWPRALAELKRTRNLSGDLLEAARQASGPTACRAIFERMGERRAAFFLSAHASLLWNRAASRAVRELNPTAAELDIAGLGPLAVPRGDEILARSACASPGHRLAAGSLVSEPYVKRRSLLVTTQVFLDEVANDELHPGRRRATLTFFLPAGAYATMLVRQLLVRTEA